MNKFNEKSIGIVGGAGPMAGIVLCEYIVKECQYTYGCVNDSDFPKIILLSIPFMQMLKPDRKDEICISNQLKNALDQLQLFSRNIAIACNTLHGFIDSSQFPVLIDMIKRTKIYIKHNSIDYPLILSTSKSIEKGVHNFKNRIYPNKRNQQKLDQLFYNIIRSSIEENGNIKAVVLACTELSVLVQRELSTENYLRFDASKAIFCVDPLKILAKTLCKNVFKTCN